MIHFAYPNADILRGRFGKCGRYLASEDAPGQDYEFADPEMTESIMKVQTAASVLAPESFDTEKRIYEISDDPNAVYQGNSKNLAYLLALVSRSRSVAVKVRGDIWCTGSIAVLDGRRPFLDMVDPEGFSIKLDGFLSQENRDTLFIVPAPIVQPDHRDKCRKANAEVLSLAQFRDRSQSGTFENKTVLTVHGSELELLVNVLFQNPLVQRGAKLKLISLIILASVLLLAGFYGWQTYYKNTASDIPNIAESGNFDTAKERLMSLGQNRTADFLQLRADKQAFKIGEPVSYHFQSEKDCYLVLLNMTSGGDLIQLFPNAYHLDQLVRAGKKYSIPGDQPDIQWEITGPPGQDEILALVSEESAFEIVPVRFALLEGNKDDPVILSQINRNIRAAEKLNLAQKRIQYSIQSGGVQK